MNVSALPKGLRRFTLDDLPRERWRNGAGWTRTVAAEERDGELLWRVTIAEISQAAPFSKFPGMNRTAVLVGGGPVLLRGPERQWQLTKPGDMACFAGELALENDAPGSEARIWNVMVRRGHTCAEVGVLAGEPVPVEAGAIHVLMWVMRGGFRVMSLEGAELFCLEAQEGLHYQPGTRGLVLHPTTSDARLVRTHLR